MDKRIRKRDPSHTRRSLKIAARNLFHSAGYFAVDSNKIAKAAAVAPGSFYRHFTGKLEIFSEVYRDWHWEHLQEIERAFTLSGNPEEMSAQTAEMMVNFYSQSRMLRASARVLEIIHPQIAAANIPRRAELLEFLRAMREKKKLPLLEPRELVSFSILLERMAEVCIEGEYSPPDQSQNASKPELTSLILKFIS